MLLKIPGDWYISFQNFSKFWYLEKTESLFFLCICKEFGALLFMYFVTHQLICKASIDESSVICRKLSSFLAP